MGTLTTALRSADLNPSGWLGAGDVAVILRSAYDPAMAAALERHGSIGRELATAGPVAVTETWGGLRTDSAQTAEYHDVLQQESELTAGHGVLRYSGLIAISAPSEPELESAVAAIEQAAIQASCEIRRLVGQQAQAFTAAALPLARTI